MRLVIGEQGDRRLGKFGEPLAQGEIRSEAVGNLENQGSRLEPAGGLVAVADRDHGQAFAAEPLEGIVKRGRDALDEDHDRRRARSGGTARLIFDERSAGEREQGAKHALVIFLIGTDQGAKRHIRPPNAPS